MIHAVCEFDLSVRASFFITRGLAIVYGVLSFLLTYVVRYIPGVLQVGCLATIKYCNRLQLISPPPP